MGLLRPSRALVLGFAFGGAVLTGRAQNIASTPADRPSPAQLAALRDGGIPAAARVTGSVVYTLGRPGYLISGPIRALTDSSSDVFVGVVSGTRTHLSGNGESIVTDYDVDVDEAIKGSAREHGRVIVQIEGGRVTLPDGTWAEVRLTNEERTDGTFELFTPPRVGERFAFFCSRTPPTLRERAAGAEPGVFYLSYGVFGLYELTRDGIVNPRGPNRDISARYRGQPSDAFLREMRASLPQITGKFTVTVDPHARVGMPLWVHADIDKELLAYPYSSDPRDLDTDSCNHLELKRNGELLTEQAPQVVVRGSPLCGSTFFLVPRGIACRCTSPSRSISPGTIPFAGRS